MNRANTTTARTAVELAKALDLGESESNEWQVQHTLWKRLKQIVLAEGLTHAELAQRAGSSRTRVTSIMNGNLDKVSTDLLVRLVGAAGYRVKISVSRNRDAA